MTQSSERRQHRILIVDDNPSIHEDFRKILCPGAGGGAAAAESLARELFAEPTEETVFEGFELDSAFQGQAALEMVEKALAEGRPYSLAFVDVRMPPGWDGIETVSRVWEVCPDLQVVICTAYSDYSWHEMHARLGKPDSLVVLKKPFDNVEAQQLAFALTRKWDLTLQARMKMDELAQQVSQRTAALERANLELAQSEERFAKAFHCSPVGMAIQSLPARRFVDLNGTLAELTGYTKDQIIGTCAGELFIWQDPITVDEWLESVSKSETMHDLETEIRSRSGQRHQVLVSLSPLTLLGAPHVMMVVRDITERNALERQLRQAQKMEAIGQLAAGVAHDFNNILTIIQGHAGLIKFQLEAGQSATESANKISKATERAATLIRQLLLFGRKQVMEFRNLDLNEAVSNCLSIIGRLVGEHISIEFNPGTFVPSVHADPNMLEQIVMNLSVNARDAMPKGGTITISTEIVAVSRGAAPHDPESRDGDFVRLRFTDTGCGMDAAVMSRIFEPFFTTKEVGHGTGLGLSTVFGIMRQHQGWIEVRSEPGRGSSFELYFPFTGEPPERTRSCSDTQFLRPGGETVLFAEDEDGLREMISQMLSSQGYKVISAASGVEALKVYETASPRVDLLVTDMVMPGGLTGGELAKQLVARDPQLKVIYTSGYSPSMAGRDHAGHNFLPKPYSIGRLCQLVRETLDHGETTAGARVGFEPFPSELSPAAEGMRSNP